MSDVEIEHERGSTDRLHDLVESKMKTAFAKQKEELLREMGSLFEKISESSNSSQLNKLNSLLVSDTPKFKRKSNEEQFRFNAKVSNKLNDVEQSIEFNSAQALDKLTEGVTPGQRPSSKPTTDISVTANDVTIKSVSGDMNRSETFQLGKPFMTEFQGNKTMMVANYKDGKLVTSPEDDNPSLPSAVRSVTGAEMCLELQIGDVVAKRYYKRK